MCVSHMKLEDWDLDDTKRFPHLTTDTFMTRVFYKYSGVTTLELSKWIRGVDKARLLNLLWVPHYHRAPINLIIIKQLLCLVHDGCLWLGESVPITDMLIHRITLLPHSGLNLAKEFCGKTGEHDLVERMKDKFKLVKNLRGYSISSITDPTVKVAIHILAGKIMRKGHADEVPLPVVSLAV